MISITLLVENTARKKGILGEHGLAWWIDTGEHAILFDTGQGMALLHNALQLKVDLTRADAIVASHGHDDHVGGMENALKSAPHSALYFHPCATERKYTGSDHTPLGRCISTDYFSSEAFRTLGHTIVSSKQPVEVVPGVWMTGEVPRTNNFEDTGGLFYLDELMKHPDPLLDDQAVFIETPQGTIVLLGCAHAGAINTLRYISELTQGKPIRAVYGGLHLENANAHRLEETLKALAFYHPEQMGFCHCTGSAAVNLIANRFPDTYRPIYSGVKIEIE